VKTTRHMLTVVVMVAAIGLAGAAQAATVFSGGSGSDSWNTGTWSAGVPSGTTDVEIAAGKTAEVQNASTPVYTGSLTLHTNATLRINNTGGDANLRALGTDGISMHGGSKISLATASDPVFPAIDLVGSASFDNPSNAADWDTRFFGAITGSGTLTLRGRNGVNYRLQATNSFSGNLVSNAVDRYRIFAEAPGSLGTGDVTINPRTTDDRSAVLIIDAADAMADTAALHLNGKGWSGSTKGGAPYSGSYIRLIMNADDTIDELWVDGVLAPPGTYTGTSGDWIHGTGVLTVTSGAANVAPTLTDMYDEFFEGAGPNQDFNQVWEDFTAVNYTVTFDKDMDESTIDAGDFGNAGTSTGWSIGTITKTVAPPTPNTPSEFNVEVLLSSSSAGTLQLQVNPGADLEDTGGLALDTTSAILDDTTITINAGNIPDATIGGTSGGNDSWNVAGNWDQPYAPFGPGSAIVDGGVIAQVNNAPPAYAGSLTLEANATLRVNHRNAIGAVETPSDITLKDGATIDIRDGSPTFGPIALQGSTSVEAQSNGAHHETFTFYGQISGAGALALNGLNNDTFLFNVANTFDGGLTASSSANQGFRLEANATGSLGLGDVTINNAATLIIDALDAMADGATLALNGDKDSRRDSKLIMNADDTIEAFYIDGADQGIGLFSAATHPGTITGTGILNVTGVSAIPEPATMAALGLAVCGLGGYVRKRPRGTSLSGRRKA